MTHMRCYCLIIIINYCSQVMDIILHCLDPGHLKMKPLNEVFPAVCRFNQVCFKIFYKLLLSLL